MNKLLSRQIRTFKKNKSAVWAMWILFAFVVLSLLTPFIANDRPIFVWYKGKAYFPMYQMYTDADFGGSLPTEVDFLDDFTQKQISDNGFMLMPPIPFSYDTIDTKMFEPSPAAPSFRHWLGTDDVGRDLVARLLYGVRISLLFGFLLTLFSSLVGVFVGGVQGYFGGKTDLILQRVLEVWSSLPQLFVLLIVSSVFLPSFWTLLLVLLLFSWTSLVSVVRAEFLRCRRQDYVKAASAMGLSHSRIMWRHILPNAVVSALTYIPFILCGSVVALTALDFLGFGMPAGSASLGDLVRQGKENLNAPWISISVFVVLTVLLSCLIFVGEGVRDALNPRSYFFKRRKSNYQLIPSSKSKDVLSVRHLSVVLGRKKILSDINFFVKKAQTVAIVGPSGSGKSITALSVLKLLDTAKVKGSIQLNGDELITKTEEQMRQIRGKKIGFIFQEPMTSLNPLHTVEKQITEVVKLHQIGGGKKYLYELLEQVGLSSDKNRILKSYPHQLSGGQRQRVMIAMALAGKPDLLIADEPTTALDVTIQKQILDLLKSLQQQLGLSVLFISHDMAVVRYMTKFIFQIDRGSLTPVRNSIINKFHHMKKYIGSPVLKITKMTVFYDKFKALDNVSFELRKGQTLALVGESGSGKTTLASALLKQVRYLGDVRLSGQIQMVFQDPFSSLNPRMSVFQIVAEGLYHSKKSKQEISKSVEDVMRQVGLNASYLNRYPHELSGGQRQRIALARALISKPSVLVLDEVTSALDEKNTARIIGLLQQIQIKTKTAFIIISHDMKLVRQIADRIVVLKDGKAIEEGKVLDVFKNPKTPYTKNLIESAFLS